jgi:tetratricopeptide (TPR) repeat protein
VNLANFQNEREQLTQLQEMFQQNKLLAGLAQAEVVLKQFPASFQLRFLKFKFLRQLKKNSEAMQLLHEMHAMFGDNIMVLKELADLNFELQKHPESLLYYKKLLFLDSFNLVAQERVKQIQGLMETTVNEKLADTKIEIRLEEAKPAVAVQDDLPPPVITFAEPPEPGVSVEEKSPTDRDPELNFETESAAELYFKQGLYRESLAIYKKLFEKTGNAEHFLKIKAILLLQRNDKNSQIIEKLQNFLQQIQKRGSQIV